MLSLFALTSLIPIVANAESKLAGKTIKIGVLTDKSGTFADYGGPNGVIAVQMAVDDFIAKNKPDFKIEVVSADHQNKPDIASAKAREWFDKDEVDLITEVLNSACAFAVSDIANEKGKVVIVTGAGSDKLSNENCKANTIHYGFDTNALSNVAAKSIAELGGKTWFMITNNYAFGQALEAEATKVVEANGGKVIGVIKHPFETTDFSSFLTQAKDPGAQVIGLANAGAGVINAVKQANEFGITEKQRVVGLLTQITDIHALGLPAARGMLFTDGFYWDRTPETREWSNRFFEKAKKMPTMIQAANYSSTLHYLGAVLAANSKDSSEIVKQMKAKPVNDFFAQNAPIREDGLLVHDMYLIEVKKPEESKTPWDYFKILKTIPGDQAYALLKDTRCPLIKKN